MPLESVATPDPFESNRHVDLKDGGEPIHHSHLPTNLASPRGQCHQDASETSTRTNATIGQRRRRLGGVSCVCFIVRRTACGPVPNADSRNAGRRLHHQSDRPLTLGQRTCTSSPIPTSPNPQIHVERGSSDNGAASRVRGFQARHRSGSATRWECWPR
jgi:hypothetical protein